MGDERAQPLRLLSLDGGGIRGLSELCILREIMERIRFKLKLDHTPLPTEYFDIVGGTSTGGLIGILLGRLRLSVKDAIEAYIMLSREVFGSKKHHFSEGKFKATKLESAAKDQVEKVLGTGCRDERMLQSGVNLCKAFVYAAQANNIAAVAGPRKFRTYEVPSNRAFDCKIWEAARATTAAPMLFSRIEIGPEGAKQEFVDAGLACNNPTKEVIKEAELLYGPQRKVACIVSIGTGQCEVINYKPPRGMGKIFPLKLGIALAEMASEADRTAEEMNFRFKSMQDLYWRFNVDRGLKHVGFDEWERLGEVEGYTQDYLNQQQVSHDIDSLMTVLSNVSGNVGPQDPGAGFSLHTIGEVSLTVRDHFMNHCDRIQSDGLLNNIRPDQIMRLPASGTDIANGVLDATRNGGVSECGGIGTGRNTELQIERSSQRLEETIMAKLEDLSRQLAGLIILADPRDRETRAELGSEIEKVQLDLISKPSLFRATCDVASKTMTCIGDVDKQEGKLMSQPSGACGDHHRRDRPGSENIVQLGSHFSNEYLQNAVQASMTIKCGAGGSSLSPSIRLPGLVDPESPAFQLVKGKSWSDLRTATDYCQRMEYVVKSLQKLFEEGRASPASTDENGLTLLHHAAFCINAETPPCIMAEGNFLESCITYMESLAKIGVPLNEPDNYGATVLDYLVIRDLKGKHSQGTALVPRLTNLGANFSDSIDWDSNFISCFNRGKDLGICLTEIVEVLKMIDEFADMFHCGTVSQATLSRSAEVLVKVLAANPDGTAERNKLGQSPLHLSADWPAGVQILLDAEVDTSIHDKAGILPISYACSPISGVLEDALHSSPRILSKVIAGLVKRRWQLGELASGVLPSEAYGISASPRRIVDEYTIRIYEALLDEGIQVPQSMLPGPSSTVYHTPGLTAKICERLYCTGFRDIDGLDHRGLTPLMALRWMWLSYTEGLDIDEGLAITCWLREKGANLLYTASNCSPPALHYMAWGIGHRARGMSCRLRLDATRTRRDLFLVLSSMSKDPGGELRNLLNFPAVDNCVCSCSAKGCTPLVMILKAFSQFIGGFTYPQLWWSEVKLAVIEWLLDAIGGTGEPINQHLHDVMHFLIFQGLGLSHTCCRFQYYNLRIVQPFDDEDAEGLHDEESFMLEVLKDLLSEAWEHWSNSSISAIDFIEEYTINLADKYNDEYPLPLTSGERDNGGEEVSQLWGRRGEEDLILPEILETVNFR